MTPQVGTTAPTFATTAPVPVKSYSVQSQSGNGNSNGSGASSFTGSARSASPVVESAPQDGKLIETMTESEPPRALWPTEWKVRASTAEEREEFRRQERMRYAAPHKAFTYRMHGYASVVGPVKGIYQHNAGKMKSSIFIDSKDSFIFCYEFLTWTFFYRRLWARKSSWTFVARRRAAKFRDHPRSRERRHRSTSQWRGNEIGYLPVVKGFPIHKGSRFDATGPGEKSWGERG